MNVHDSIARLDRLLDGLEAEVLAASEIDVLGALSDTGRVRTAVLHEVRAVIARIDKPLERRGTSDSEAPATPPPTPRRSPDSAPS